MINTLINILYGLTLYLILLRLGRFLVEKANENNAITSFAIRQLPSLRKKHVTASAFALIRIGYNKEGDYAECDWGIREFPLKIRDIVHAFFGGKLKPMAKDDAKLFEPILEN